MAETALSPGVNLPPTGIPLVDTGFTIIAQQFALAQTDLQGALDASGGVGTVPTNPPVPSSISVRIGNDGSFDVSLTWNYTIGTIAPDFMILFWKQGPASLSAPLSSDKAILLASTATSFTFQGLDPSSNYRFGVGAARKDSAGTAVVVGTIIAPDGSVGPDWADINGTGNYFLLINNIPASTVTANAADGKTAYTGTANFRSAGAPNANPAPDSLFAGVDTDASARYIIGWKYTHGTIPADGFIFFVKEGNTTTFVAEDPHFELAAQRSVSQFVAAITLKGYPSDRVLSFAVAAFRKSDLGLEITAPFTSTAGPDWTGISSGSPSYAGTIYGVDQHNFTLNVAGGSATDISNGIQKDGNALVWTPRDNEFEGHGTRSTLGLSYNLTLYNLTTKTADYQHCHDVYDYGAAGPQDTLVPALSGGGVLQSGQPGKFGFGIHIVTSGTQRAYLVSQAAHADFRAVKWAELWFKASAPPTATATLIGATQNADGSGYGVPFLSLTTGGIVTAQAFDGTVLRQVVSSQPSIIDSAWHHLAANVTTNGLSVWVDGQRTGLAASGLTSFTVGAPATLWLQVLTLSSATQYYGTADIDEVIISDSDTLRVATLANFAPPVNEIPDYLTGVNMMYAWHLQEVWFSSAYYPCNARRPAKALGVLLNCFSEYSLQTATKYAMFLGGAHEPQQNRLLDGLPDAIVRVGGTKSLFTANSFQFNSAYGLVGFANAGEGNGFEAYNGKTASDPLAHVQINFQSQNDKLVGTGSVGWKPVTTPGPPTNSITPSSSTVINRNTGNDLVILGFTYTQPVMTGNNLLADGFVVYVKGGVSGTPQNAPNTTQYLGITERSFYYDAPPTQQWSFAIAAYRHTANGQEVGPPVTSTSPNWQGIGAANLVTTPGITDNNVTTTKRQLVNTQSAGSGNINQNSGTNPVIFGFGGTAFTHGLGRTPTSTSSSSNSSAIGVWPANGPTQIVVSCFHFGGGTQSSTLTADYW